MELWRTWFNYLTDLFNDQMVIPETFFKVFLPNINLCQYHIFSLFDYQCLAVLCRR